MPRLAIVISAVGSIESLEATLVSVLENRPADCEIVVALAAPYADPYDLKDEVRFIAPKGSTSSVAAINRALSQVRAPFVHLLASGCRASEGWADAALARFGDRRLGSVAPVVWSADCADRIFAAGVGYSVHGWRYRVGQRKKQLDAETQREIVGPCLFAGFYRKAALDIVGGLSARLGPRQADADLALMLRHAGFISASEPRSQLWAFDAADPLVGSHQQALFDERLFWRNLPETSCASALAGHALGILWELGGSLPRPRLLAQLAGRLRGTAEMFGHARHRRALAELDARAVPEAVAGEHVRIDRLHESPTRAGETNRARTRSY